MLILLLLKEQARQVELQKKMFKKPREPREDKQPRKLQDLSPFPFPKLDPRKDSPCGAYAKPLLITSRCQNILLHTSRMLNTQMSQNLSNTEIKIKINLRKRE